MKKLSLSSVILSVFCMVIAVSHAAPAAKDDVVAQGIPVPKSVTKVVIGRISKDDAAFKSPKVPDEKKDWLADHIKTLKTIKVGMTRADVNKLLLRVGGLTSDLTKITYRSIESPYIKIDIEYQFADEITRKSSPQDKIIKISKPYLELPLTDEDIRDSVQSPYVPEA